MVMHMDFPVPVGLLSNPGDLKPLSFSDTVKYCVLGVSVALLLLALGILAWQTIRCCTQTPSTYNQQDTVNSDLLYPDEKTGTSGNFSGAPSTRVEDVTTEVHRLSRGLSHTLFPSSESGQSDVDTGEQAIIKKVDGTLHFSVYHDQLPSSLVVTVLQVEGLVEHSQKRSLHPFVKISLMWACPHGIEMESCMDEEGQVASPVMWTVLQEWRTRIVKGSCNPLFGDQFSCILQEDKELRHLSLRMEVRDYDKFSRHMVLGEVRVPLGQLNLLYPLELNEDLQIPQKDIVGEVLLSLKFLPTSQRLEVGLLKVRTVLPESGTDAVLYAKISVQCNQCKLRNQKTSAVAHGLFTVFNEVLMFSLPDLPLEQCKISVSMYAASKTYKQLIGQFSVEKGKGSEDKHWGLMMQLVRQPVARWHGLLI